MPPRHAVRLCVFVLCLFVAAPALACTTLLAGKKATVDGAVLVSHSEDGLNDPRVVFVPAMDHKPGALRPVFYDQVALGFKPQWGGAEQFRLKTKTRGPSYDVPGVPDCIPLGHIPQVPHTYAYFDGNYGIMNVHQLSIGECTDKAKVHPEPAPGKRIMYSAELSRIALERCKTAREAVLLMGELIEQYGYYGTGETLLVADPNEGWVMEMCGYDLEGTGGVWVAQRVPDDGFFAAANQFRIREVKKDDKEMLFSKNIFEVAQQKGWWKPQDGDLDFAAAYGDGEFQHPYYSLRRVWRALSLVAPSLKLPAWVEGPNTRAYPFAVKPDHKLNVADLIEIHRDTYQGTEFDMSKGLAAGPFGNPIRYEGKAEALADADGKLTPLTGAFERPISIYRTVFTYVNQSRSWLPNAVGGVVWLGPDRAANSLFMPFYAGATGLPASIQKADILRLDRGSLWTAFNYVDNYATLNYARMSQDIDATRDSFEARFFGEQAELEAQAKTQLDKGLTLQARLLLTQRSEANAAAVLKEWWALSEKLYVKYNDGYLNTKNGVAQPLFYPSEWLKKVGYEQGPASYEKPAAAK